MASVLRRALCARPAPAAQVATRVALRVGGFSKAAAKKVAESVTEPLASRVAQTSDAASAAVSAAQRSPLGKGAEVAGGCLVRAQAGPWLGLRQGPPSAW